MIPSILIIYTGGTIGMVHNPDTGSLSPIDFKHISAHVPELRRLGYRLESITFDPVIDSSDVNPEIWKKLAVTISDHYNEFDGFVVLHGTDTMAYSASALSFMLVNLDKPVIFTGAQLPIGVLRTDGKENLITAIEIAAAKENGNPTVPEVCIYFENRLLRGNRTTKYSAEQFNAFTSPNLPPLARAGIQIKYNSSIVRYPTIRRPFQIINNLDNGVFILKLFPGIRKEAVQSLLTTKELHGIVLETYGTGNAPTLDWLISALKDFILRGGIVLNVTQCLAGQVEMGLYETSNGLIDAGVISGKDITTEAALTKMMVLLASSEKREKIERMLAQSLRGEIS